MKQFRIQYTTENGNQKEIHVDASNAHWDTDKLFKLILSRISYLCHTNVDIETDAAGIITTFKVKQPLDRLTESLLKFLFRDSLHYTKFYILQSNKTIVINDQSGMTTIKHTFCLDPEEKTYTVLTDIGNRIEGTKLFDVSESSRDRNIHVFQDDTSLYEELTGLITDWCNVYRNRKMIDALKHFKYNTVPPTYLTVFEDLSVMVYSFKFPLERNRIYQGDLDLYSMEVYSKLFQSYLETHEEDEIYLFIKDTQIYFIVTDDSKLTELTEYLKGYNDLLLFGTLTSYPDDIYLPHDDIHHPGEVVHRCYRWMFDIMTNINMHKILETVLMDIIQKQKLEVKIDTEIDLSGVTL